MPLKIRAIRTPAVVLYDRHVAMSDGFESNAAASDSSLELDYVRKLWENTRNSDAEIRLADGQVIKVHKLIVSRCEFFRAAFESGFKEGHSKIIDLPEDDPAATIIMLKWLYGYTVDEMLRRIMPLKAATTSKKSTKTVKLGLLDMVKLWELCDKYSLTDLQHRTTPHFCRMLNEKLGNESLDPEAWTAIKDVYASEIKNSELREEIKEALTDNLECQSSDAPFQKALGDQFRHCPELAAEIAVKYYTV